MQKTFDKIARVKMIDVSFQVLAFAAMIYVILRKGSIGIFGMYIMAIVQYLSAIAWVFGLSEDTPKLKSAAGMRKFFIAFGSVLFCCGLLLPDLFLGVSLLMIFAGPVLGTIYFMLSFEEIRFYRNARKPYYLL